MSHPRRLAALAAAAAAVLGACAAPQGVATRSAAPVEPSPTAPGADGAVDVTPPTTPATEPAPTPAPTTTVPTTTVPPTTVPTLPPIVEAELFVTIPFDEVVDADEGKPPRGHDEFVAVALADIERWWSEQYPAVFGDEFRPLVGGVFAGYPERTSPIPGCPRGETTYEDLQLFVAFYCQLGDFMAYDDGDGEGPFGASILTPLADAFGPAVVGVVLAHEYGHAIQWRSGELDRALPTIITEQQADCYAGAWTGQAFRGESELLQLGDSDVRAGLLAMLEVRDPVGTSQFELGGHGSAFDRVGAFQEGFVQGPARCAELIDEPLPLMPNQFQPFSLDELLGGNAPYDCSELAGLPGIDEQDIAECTPAPVFLIEDVNHFWATALGDDFDELSVRVTSDLDAESCAGLVRVASIAITCVLERTIVYDEPALLELYTEFGDFTLGYIYGVGSAEIAQADIGSPLAGEERALLNDCFTGAWVRDITPDEDGTTPRQGDRDGDGEDDTVNSSPGDLDEAIQMAIIEGDIGANVNVIGSPFEKIEAFRAGVLGGLDACASRLPD